jgi:hypothetical protein
VRVALPASLIMLLLSAAVPVRAQLSPGPLSEAHQSLEGVTQCFQCHESGAGAVDAKCLACHTEIGWLVTRGRGLHGRIQSKRCAQCHPDHAGRAFQLVRWDEGAAERFDHQRTGFVLDGRHGKLKCVECHQPRFQKSGGAALIRKRDRAASWLGLERSCASCHDDPHQGQLGAACADCHGHQAWKPATGFDHAKTAFPLTGLHAKVECAKCHTSPRLELATDAQGKPVPRWKPLSHTDCVSCHKNPHSRRFPGACTKCHTTQGFQVFDAKNFDHERTRYPLRGRHATVACAKCHGPKLAGGQKPAFDRCDRCHRDSHAGLATLAGRPADCVACHSVQGWKPSTYSVSAHQASAYPLEGRHALVPCAKCHPQGPDSLAARLGAARVLLRPARGGCLDCHTDPHRGRFEAGGARAKAGSCRTCHTMNGYRPTLVDAAAHARLGYPLAGAHRAVPCQSCHTELKVAPATAVGAIPAAARGWAASGRDSLRTLLLAGTATACADCHQSPHGDQFKGRRARRKDGPAGDACDACHGIDSFKPADRFNHEKDSAFRLAGAHAKVRCEGCHKSSRDAQGKSFVVYKPTPVRCEDCHVHRLPGAS